jgi:hypothetical protein
MLGASKTEVGIHSPTLSATALKEAYTNLGLKHKLFLLANVLSYLAACGDMLFIAFIPTTLALEFGDELEPPLSPSFSPTFLVLFALLSDSALLS